MEPLPEAPLPLPNDAPHLLERLAAEQPGQRIQTSVRQALQRQTQAQVLSMGPKRLVLTLAIRN